MILFADGVETGYFQSPLHCELENNQEHNHSSKPSFGLIL